MVLTAAQKQKRYREKKVTRKVTEIVTVTRPKVTVTRNSNAPVTGTVTPEGIKHQVPSNYGQLDCQCMHCQQNRRSDHRLVLNHGAYKPAGQLGRNEWNRVSLPGDVDYDGAAGLRLLKQQEDRDRARRAG